MPLNLVESESEDDPEGPESANESGSQESTSSSGLENLQALSDSLDSVNVSSHSSSSTGQKETGECQAAMRRARTAKARAAAITAKAQRRLASNAVLQFPDHPANIYREDIKADNTLIQPGANRARRCRLLCSYLQAWGPALTHAVGRRRRSSRISHTLTTSVIDDCNMRLSSVVPGVSHWKMSRIVSIMNNCQCFILGYVDPTTATTDKPAAVCHDHFQIHTAPAILPKTDRSSLCAEFLSRLFVFLGSVGSRFADWKIPVDLVKDVRIQGVSLSFDSLATNIAVLKQLRLAVWKQHQEFGHETICPLFSVCCNIHQLALARKPILQGFSNFYTSILRLSHLFEVHSFRVHFRSALLHVLVNSFTYVAVAERPSEHRSWQDYRKQCCSVLTDQQTGYNKKRLELHLELMKWDNSDVESDCVIHYCTGDCCKGLTHESKQQFARLQICRLYLLLFSFGFPVPLQYRWLHVHRALRYCREP